VFTISSVEGYWKQSSHLLVYFTFCLTRRFTFVYIPNKLSVCRKLYNLPLQENVDNGIDGCDVEFSWPRLHHSRIHFRPELLPFLSLTEIKRSWCYIFKANGGPMVSEMLHFIHIVGSGGIAPQILTPVTVYKLAFSWTPQPLYPRAKSIQQLFADGCVGPRSG
jgi:hypothetical protein